MLCCRPRTQVIARGKIPKGKQPFSSGDEFRQREANVRAVRGDGKSLQNPFLIDRFWKGRELIIVRNLAEGIRQILSLPTD